MNQVTFVEKVAHKLTSLGLAAPAVLLLEAHKPLTFIGSQFLLVAQPTLNLFVSPHFTQSMVDLLADPNQLEQLISHLERQTSPETPLGRRSARNVK
ncbi:MAG: hypothetical protein HYR94_06530 [Chloroflexi bacterium]|nr:hypothetical protein [Chloroflexota bacterium]